MTQRPFNNAQGRPPTVMIVAGEASGDLHGGALAKALFRKNETMRIVGFGGEAMRAAGVDIRFDVNALGIVGLFEVLYHLKDILRAYRTARKLLREGIDLLVLIDFPDFNLRLAKAAKGLNIPVVYYVSPQIWAWRAQRIKTIAERVDQMLVILPFEKALYEAANVPCEFVGHPLMDELADLGIESSSNRGGKEDAAARTFLSENELNPAVTTIALLPGSRTREVVSLLPVMLQGVEALVSAFPKLQVLIPLAASLSEETITQFTLASSLPIRIVKDNIYSVFLASDAAVVASGTATLQAALAGTPMVIVYKVSFLTYCLGRLLIKKQSIGLVNIVAGNPFIPELIQGAVSPSRISQEIGLLLRDEAARDKMKQGLQNVVDRLGTAGASERAATIVYDLLRPNTTKEMSSQ